MAENIKSSMFNTDDGGFSIVYSGIMKYEIWYQTEKIIHEEVSFNNALQWLLSKNYIDENCYESNRKKGLMS